MVDRTSCPLPAPGPPRGSLRARHFLPLLAYLLSSIVIGYGIVLPRHGGAGVNALTMGFAASLVGASLAYIRGVAVAARR